MSRTIATTPTQGNLSLRCIAIHMSPVPKLRITDISEHLAWRHPQVDGGASDKHLAGTSTHEIEKGYQ